MARGEYRRRWEKRRQERWVDVTEPIASGDVGGVVRACRSGVIGGGVFEPD